MKQSNSKYSPIIALIGPTAAGKSAVGMELAEQLGGGGEIVSADSRQVYRELTIGTAKPSPSELRRIPHHFIDELETGAPFSAGQFAEAAADRIEQILHRAKTPIVVGGSTLYVEALLHGLSEIPPTSARTRTRLMEQLEAEGAGALFEELRRVDPESAATMDATKTQRVVRALEVYIDTQRPLSSYHKRAPAARFSFAPIVLTRPRPILYDRINRRVDHMLAAGLLEENRRLLDTVPHANINPLRTIGYREPMAHLRGEIDFDEMVRRLKRNSRRYAKRQLTWFRRHNEYAWIDLEETEEPLKRISEIAWQ